MKENQDKRIGDTLSYNEVDYLVRHAECLATTPVDMAITSIEKEQGRLTRYEEKLEELKNKLIKQKEA